MTARLEGLVAATHTPFEPDGSLALAVVEAQAGSLLENGVGAVFIGGTTGECLSLTVEERLALARRWVEVTRGTPMRVVVHVGSNCLPEARALASEAERLGVAAVSAFAPSYFRPGSVEALVEWCAGVASAAAGLPFYFYDIPSMTGVSLAMPEFLERRRERIPNLAGLKFTNADLMAYQLCMRAGGGCFDVLWGMDECLLAALVLGARGAVGSTYNFAAPVYHRMRERLEAGDLEGARAEQFRSVRLVEVLSRYGYLPASRALMGMLGVEVGAARLPLRALSPGEIETLRTDLEELGYFGWI